MGLRLKCTTVCVALAAIWHEFLMLAPQEVGWLCHVRMQQKLDLPPDKAYDIISDPDNARIFRNIEVRLLAVMPPRMARQNHADEKAELNTILSRPQECTHRKILHDNGRGRLRVEVDHQSGWRFLWHKGQFTTKLLVEQVSMVINPAMLIHLGLHPCLPRMPAAHCMRILSCAFRVRRTRAAVQTACSFHVCLAGP